VDGKSTVCEEYINATEYLNTYVGHFPSARLLKKNITFRKLILLPSSDKRFNFTLRIYIFIKSVVCEFAIYWIKLLRRRHLCWVLIEFYCYDRVQNFVPVHFI
jgi:hypothetical protein